MVLYQNHRADLVPVAGHLGPRAALRAVGLEISACGRISSRPSTEAKQKPPRPEGA